MTHLWILIYASLWIQTKILQCWSCCTKQKLWRFHQCCSKTILGFLIPAVVKRITFYSFVNIWRLTISPSHLVVSMPFSHLSNKGRVQNYVRNLMHNDPNSKSHAVFHEIKKKICSNFTTIAILYTYWWDVRSQLNVIALDNFRK